MKKTLIVTVLTFAINLCHGQDYMTKILQQTCDCVGKVSDTLNIDESNMQIGVCMISAATPYKKQLKKDFDIDLDNVDTEGEKIGKAIGVKMAGFCPDMLVKLTKRNGKSNTETPNIEIMKGVITKVENDFFVIFSVKDESGKIAKLYWTTFLNSNVELTTSYATLLGKAVQISYKKEDYFDPKIEQYRQYFIITKLQTD